tara:strand:+ start:96 stop:605 length:510 start_codon:yes stop_codon:yes gene_type:complete
MLDFKHSIILEIHNEQYPSTVEVSVNNELKHEKEYTAGTHKEHITFSHAYKDGDKNKLTICFSADNEAESKHIKVMDICINGASINLLNAVYKPVINQHWWDSLGERDRDHFTDVIHGNTGNTFGWYGDVSYVYYTVKDKATKTKIRNAVGYDNEDDIVGKRTEWIYND